MDCEDADTNYICSLKSSMSNNFLHLQLAIGLDAVIKSS
jgi:hypothetical protein